MAQDIIYKRIRKCIFSKNRQLIYVHIYTYTYKTESCILQVTAKDNQQVSYMYFITYVPNNRHLEYIFNFQSSYKYFILQQNRYLEGFLFASMFHKIFQNFILFN